jgi:tetratricopeptide (TPR) repeat protein
MSANPSQQRMQQGHAARRAGRTAEALDHYRTAVEQDPESAEANSVYGLMLLQVGRTDEAETPLRRAVEIAPTHAALRMNLAQWLAQQQRFDEAVGIVAGIVDDEPQQAWAWERLGELKAKQRRFGEAAEHFQRATELQPQDPSLLFKRAQANFDAGETAEAERILGESSRLAPGNAAILRLYASIHESRADWAALERAAQAWGAAQPREPGAWRALAKAQWETGYFRQAMQNFRHALGLGERSAWHLATYARLCISALEFESAAKALDEAEALNPELGHMLSAKAVLLMVSGRYDEAESYVRRALVASPNEPSAYKALAQLTNGRLSKEEMTALEALIDRKDSRLVDRVTAAFAFADSREAQGDAKPAFAAYERANRLARDQGRAEGLSYDPSARHQQVDELIARFETVPALGKEGNGPRAVFIVGMPRSGTTLIESIIGAHSKVLACGERMAMRWIMERFLPLGKPASAIDEETWRDWRQSYWQEVPEQPGIRVVTDKNPWNFDAIGIIARLFPDARIIHVRRSPVETGLSIFRNQFGKANQYANRLEDIGHYYGEYARLMAHWERVAAGRFTTLQYEDFVRDFDAAGPALLTACGLDWEPGCRNFWESRRVIGTMSTMQVRRPLESRASRAESYGDLLEPLQNALRKAGIDLKTGEYRGNS